ncbi:hypothetical protein [Actinobacillus minor]|uniref:hypothetical protein n=1 Tax=Actinobacillus minor TaxID=51047 RepID=UPI0026EB9D3A|nr:hypothetical protein [Actinobacillus minor]
MKYSYRITRYFKYSENGYLTDDGWTSYCDVGKSVSLAEYLNSEEQYISTIINICKHLNIGCLRVSKLCNSFEKSTVKNKELISLSNLPEVLRGILREEFWCKLVHKKCQFHFGYDGYMYCVSEIDLFEFLIKISKLHIEKYPSPYYRKNNL